MRYSGRFLVLAIAAAATAFILPGVVFAQAQPRTVAGTVPNEAEAQLVKAGRIYQQVQMGEWYEHGQNCSMCQFMGMAGPGGAPPQLADKGEGHDEEPQASARNLGTGVAGAAELEGFGVWASVAYTDFEDDLSTTEMEGHNVSGSVGLDHRFTDRLIGGLSVGRNDTVVTTLFNSGDTHSQGLLLAPYVAYQLGPVWSLHSLSLDATVGMSQIDVETERRLVGGGVARGDTDTSRKFGAVNVTASRWIGRFNLSGTAGYLRSHDTTDAYRETTTVNATGQAVTGARILSTNSTLGQVRVGARASYYTPWAQPYVKATYEFDQSHPDVRSPNPNLPAPENDDDGVVVGGGLSLAFQDWLSGAVEATTVETREDFDSWTVSGNLRLAL